MSIDLAGYKAKLSLDTKWSEPIRFDLSQADAHAKLLDLLRKNEAWIIYDQVGSAAEDLFDIKYPEKKDIKSKEELESFTQELMNGNPDTWGEWVFFPWSKELVHFPNKQDLRSLRTSRNRNLITSEEQQKLYEGTILVIGLSVGSNVAEALISQGIGGKLVLVDMDILEPSNLNRIRAPYKAIGDHKVDHVAKKISETDPYIEQIHYRKGLTEQNLVEILENHKPDVIIDEMDDVRMKLRLREIARDHKLPVIMAADDGDNILLDIERYDQKAELQILHGNIPEEITDMLLHDQIDIPRNHLGMIIGKYFVGLENTPLRMFESLGEVGKTLPSWPQLGGAAALAGIVLAYCTRQILLGHPLNDGRFVIGPDAQLNPEINTQEYKEKVESHITHINQLIDGSL